MSEMFEQLRQKALAAKEEKTKQEQLGAQKVQDESKGEILAELEQGHQKLGELALQEAETNAKISQLFHEIRATKQETKKILEETIPAAEKDEAFEGQEELRVEAIRLLQAEAKTLEDLIPAKEAELEEARKQHGEIKTEVRGLLGKAKGYIGEREISEGRMNEIWSYVKKERDTKESLNSYRGHASREASYFAYWASGEKGSYQSGTVIKTPDGNQVTHTFEEGHTYLWGTPKEIFTNPRFCNEYISGFKQGLDKFLQEGKGWHDEKLLPGQIERIKQIALRLGYRDEKHPERDKEILIYDGVNPVRLEGVPEDKFLTSLTSGERKIIEEPITNYEKRENLEKRLRLSEYREDVHEAILQEAKAENEEYNRRALAEKLPELQDELERTSDKLKEHEAKLGKLKEAETLLRQAYQILDTLSVKTYNLESSKSSVSYAKERAQELQAEREALPKRLLSKKPKDEGEDRRLVQKIEKYEQNKASAQRSADSYGKEIEQAEQQLVGNVTKLEALRAGISEVMDKIRSSKSTRDRENEFYRELDNLQREIIDTERLVREAKAKVQKLEWTKREWEKGRRLTSSLAGMLAKRR